MPRLGDQCDSSSLNGKNAWATCTQFIHWFLFHVLPHRRLYYGAQRRRRRSSETWVWHRGIRWPRQPTGGYAVLCSWARVFLPRRHLNQRITVTLPVLARCQPDSIPQQQYCTPYSAQYATAQTRAKRPSSSPCRPRSLHLPDAARGEGLALLACLSVCSLSYQHTVFLQGLRGLRRRVWACHLIALVCMI